MPNTKSSKATLRHDLRRQSINAVLRDKLKAALTQVRKKPSAANTKLAISLLDKAARKRIIHPTKAKRLKARLQRKK
ncbi:hypothetical protein A3K55_02265 [Candidatus Shapirobacteria bacterium RBG_13_44_7]|uniref:Small ribosomal subunit protein bS20 n=1 Tax=Candidatus Shapirobacteria bacterium RBG_13_44_7 TaxID=1802149 RepID=A0A1F7SKS4_9BACT|nr:MAG: hypothetical protein A3K55_02265 [Candidatus Shapirobacteria bacterium RBG_13_44_7]